MPLHCRSSPHAACPPLIHPLPRHCPQLESEVVALQQDQAAAAATLQVSHEQLLQSRSQLLAAKGLLDPASASGQAGSALDEVRGGGGRTHAQRSATASCTCVCAC